MVQDYTTENFKLDELRCKCGKCRGFVPHSVQPAALDALQRVRDRYFQITKKGIPLNSAYRCAEHLDEVKKIKPGKHNEGTAFDLRVPWGRDRMLLIKLLIEEGFDAFGFANSFLHADYNRGYETSWTYN
ncbi:D-Ala-D-Ala carboxypeptidase family metallohydrolase [Vibrio astriarenae]